MHTWLKQKTLSFVDCVAYSSSPSIALFMLLVKFSFWLRVNWKNNLAIWSYNEYFFLFSEYPAGFELETLSLPPFYP